MISTQLLDAASNFVTTFQSNPATRAEGDQLQQKVGEFLKYNWNRNDADGEFGLIIAPYISADDGKHVHPLKSVDVYATTSTTPSKTDISSHTSPLTTTTVHQSPPINIHVQNNNDDESSDDDSVAWAVPEYVFNGIDEEDESEEDSDYEEDDNNTTDDDDITLHDYDDISEGELASIQDEPSDDDADTMDMGETEPITDTDTTTTTTTNQNQLPVVKKRGRPPGKKNGRKKGSGRIDRKYKKGKKSDYTYQRTTKRVRRTTTVTANNTVNVDKTLEPAEKLSLLEQRLLISYYYVQVHSLER